MCLDLTQNFGSCFASISKVHKVRQNVRLLNYGLINYTLMN